MAASRHSSLPPDAAAWDCGANDTDAGVAALARRMLKCRVCVETPDGTPLPHQPKPVFRISATARIAICSQAPGTRAHASGVPFTDPSGVRLRQWLATSETEFYDRSRVAILPMGFCFPGLDAKGGDRPPRRECAPTWREEALAAIGDVELLLLIGAYAQKWHLGARAGKTLTATVANWRAFAFATSGPRVFPLPHPSWRNTAWLKANPWFASDVLPELQVAVQAALAGPNV